MKQNMVITTLLAASTMLLSCNEKGLLDPAEAFPAFSIVDGDTVKTRDDKKNLKSIQLGDKNGFLESAVNGDTIIVFKDPIKAKPKKTPDLSKLKNNNIPELKGQKFKLVSAGGDLALGFRDGGIFNEGILTGFPNLIANQMGVEFKSPLFDADEYNGLGRKLPTTFNPTGGKVPKQKEVINNLAIEDNKIKKYSGKTDNFFLNAQRSVNSHINVNNSRLQNSYYAYGEPLDKNNESIANSVYFKNKKFDFIFVDIGLQNVIGGNLFENFLGVNGEENNIEILKKVKTGDDVKIGKTDGLGIFTGPIYSSFFQILVSKQLNRGIIVNCPSLSDLPYYSIDYAPDIRKIMDTYNVSHVYGGLVRDNVVWGTSKVDSIIAPNVNINLKPGINGQSIYTIYNNYGTSKFNVQSNTISRIDEKIGLLNKNSSVYSEYSNMPLFDINSFYKKIKKEGFITVDGVKVDASWPKGNFFSSDGIYPSAFGQAVIANEIIKVMNSFYKMEIELIPTKAYLK